MTTAHQLTLDALNLPDPKIDRSQMSIEERFQEFHALNPHVFEAIVKEAREKKHDLGWRHWGMKAIFELLRHQRRLHTQGEETWLLNNSFTAHYARLVMERCEDLRGFFEVREKEKGAQP